MKREISNAFTNAAARPDPRRSLASLLSPMQAMLSETGFGWALALQPIRLIDVAAVWTRFEPGRAARTLVADLQSDVAPVMSLERNGADLVEHGGCEMIVVDDAALLRLARDVHHDRALLVRVDGPIEPRDAGALRTALDRCDQGRSPLDVEIRATAAAQLVRNRAVTLHVRRREDARLRLVAENFRHYLAALCNQPLGRYGPPTIDQLDALLADGATMMVRPIETDVYSTSIDIGISTGSAGEPQPANRSLIYDLPSGTWHGEE